MPTDPGLKRSMKLGLPSRGWRLLTLVLSLGSLAAVGWFAYAAFRTEDLFEGMRWPFFAAAVLLHFSLLLLLPLLWQRLVRSLWPGWRSASFSRFLLLQAYSRSWLARYIPGRVWMFGGRLLLARRLGLPGAVLVRSMVLEVFFSYGMLTLLGTALLLGALASPVAGVAVAAAGAIVALLGAPGALKLVGSGQRRTGPGLLARALRRLSATLIADSPLPSAFTRWTIVAYGLHAALQLLFIILLTRGFVDLSAGQAVTVAGAWAVSSALGYFSFFSAGGLGVRDGAALGLLAPVLTAPVAGAVVAASRIVLIGADFAFVGLVELAALSAKSKQHSPDSAVEVESD